MRLRLIQPDRVVSIFNIQLPFPDRGDDDAGVTIAGNDVAPGSIISSSIAEIDSLKLLVEPSIHLSPPSLTPGIRKHFHYHHCWGISIADPPFPAMTL